ncbi:phosphatase PAP2 family protein [Sphingomonas panacisoli]|uniref:Phosphatase PAP2 family protein n=1 Tax=Sphingomonas panacisoli TaxID=1813879 RepID=A0A5B8LHI2_9SPHN|nr:phosphatase PAP2 family protein [Sphingomonas panacisoli]QDZ07265.1 phosphatase PAP2 family protein [Sphingomonas panacisoli]
MTEDNPQPRIVRPWLWPALGLFVASLVGLGAYLADELLEGEGWAIDQRLLLGLRVPGDLQRPIGPAWLQQSAVDISALGGPTLMWLFGISGLIWLLYRRQRAEAAWIAVSLIGASLISNSLKYAIGRPRPALVPHLVQVNNASFPSGHSLVSAALYLTLALMLAEGAKSWSARIAIVGFGALLVVLIGCSRVYLGVHWPSDVLGGWSFGTAWALSVFAANRWLHRTSQAAPRPTP